MGERNLEYLEKLSIQQDEWDQLEETDQGLILDNSNYEKGQPYID